MRNMRALVIFSTFLIMASKSEDTRDACDRLAKCMEDVVNERKSCDAIQAQIDSKWPLKLTDHQLSVNTKADQVTQMDYNRRLQKAKCLQNSLANTTIVSCDLKRIAECANITSSYKPRAKRQVNNTSQPVNATQNCINTCIAQADAAAKKLADQQEKTNLQNQLNACRKSASDRDAQCSLMAGCCSESWLCDLEFQATSAFVDSVKLQHALQIERRSVSCPAPPSPTTPSTKAPTTVIASG